MKEIQKHKRGGNIRGWVSGWRMKREERGKGGKEKEKNETRKKRRRKRGKGELASAQTLTFFWVLIFLHRVSLLLSLSLSQPLRHSASLSKFLFILFTFFVPSHVSGFQSAGTSGQARSLSRDMFTQKAPLHHPSHQSPLAIPASGVWGIPGLQARHSKSTSTHLECF